MLNGKALTHAEVLKNLKENVAVLNCIYEENPLEKWTNEKINNVVLKVTDIKINLNDELLMKRLRDFFNV